MKLNDWKNNFSKWLEKGYVCGDTIEKIGLLREFSISQFTYQTIEQYLAVEKEVQRNKRRYNQSYQEMIETIDKIISTGAKSVNREFGYGKTRTRNESPYFSLKVILVILYLKASLARKNVANLEGMAV